MPSGSMQPLINRTFLSDYYLRHSDYIPPYPKATAHEEEAESRVQNVVGSRCVWQEQQRVDDGQRQDANVDGGLHDDAAREHDSGEGEEEGAAEQEQRRKVALPAIVLEEEQRRLREPLVRVEPGRRGVDGCSEGQRHAAHQHRREEVRVGQHRGALRAAARDVREVLRGRCAFRSKSAILRQQGFRAWGSPKRVLS